ncbi:UDP-N-acetylglucosamine 2-epimerase (non-hydrolyzing) [Leptospira kanakyensis]|uniref:UDP-N-acetylglucosamine 2-epimerase (Non-hydrolyzing) n=1 Tax=Leptospira kanakyensis TaxID=2484968 RepID=A0A6N4QID9_9LEPT|nr:UDP-N-acetylglucosamine 2-epimerase (non-hydrolyzing) [Leptospira kanakyensis]TGK51908.1 UDP-N-acetylglucosamine 2-epimerase (non-hydrolyzing) [Leptospira kanakyensis]TGK57184.1 UDP-N-acetylglucosamine 2-epimerase (non-hydrolyzing) [Leptospira kanakyensis]TGK71800.1 UDP-N-acetylglucosamine 2-epimerase (non-hydrolyzing) [Leptospira kanakyensis]
MLKVLTLVGTRPELIKMSRVIAAMDKHFNHIFVHSGQNYDYELNHVFFDDLEIRKPDYFLNVASDTVAKTIAAVLVNIDEVLEKENPDAILIYGDTNTCLAVISAKRRKIPVFHMEAGNRCFDERVPEELNRKVVDHLSDINIVLTEHARRYLLNEGIKPETIFKSGSHMKEVLDYYAPKIKKSKILSELALSEKEYFLVSIHREENVDNESNLLEMINSLKGLALEYKIPVIVSTHPRTKKRLESLGIQSVENIQFLKPFGFLDYIFLQQNAKCVISDSGTITEEAAILKFPAITIRNTHERPEGMDTGVLILSGLKELEVLESVNISISVSNQKEVKNENVFDYFVDDVSSKIVNLVQSYTGYVNRVVWKKNT